MVSRVVLTKFLDDEFSFFIGEDDSCNGLQYEGKPEVKKIGFAVDACLDVFEKTTRADCNFLVVHHGLFWKKVLPTKIEGVWKKRLKVLEEADLSLYAMHLPLDAHPTFGNNVELACLLDLKDKKQFAEYRGTKLGFYGSLPKEMTLKDLTALVEKKLGAETRLLEFGEKTIKTVGCCSGGSAFAIPSAHTLGLDCLLIGEMTHAWFHWAREEQVNVLAAGHYATETLGVKALARVVEKKFGMQTVFLDSPSGF